MDAAPLLLGKEVVDSPEVKTAGEAWGVFVAESKKLWKVAVPIVFYILCLYGINSTTQIFAGHIGNLELSAVAIALSVISGFSFGFLAQSKVNVMAWMSGTTLLCHVGLLWLFIYVFGWGMNGAAAAYNISLWLLALAQTVYVMRWCKEGWRGFSWDAFKGIWAFVRLSLASAVMICLEIWYMMILVLLTGHLSDAQIAVGSISICMNINGWESTMFVGVNAAISIRISNELGSGRPRTAMYSVIVVIITSLAIGLLCMVGVLALRDYFPVIFTTDKNMQRAVSKIAGLLGLTMVLNSIQPVISGVAVGGGWQALVAYINLGCYYVFGLPLGFVFGYLLHWGFEGIWIGMLCGIALQTLILLLIIWKTNWKHEASQASERVRLWGGQDDNIKSLS